MSTMFFLIYLVTDNLIFWLKFFNLKKILIHLKLFYLCHVKNISVRDVTVMRCVDDCVSKYENVDEVTKNKLAAEIIAYLGASTYTPGDKWVWSVLIQYTGSR